jgi:hypothetical protein
MQSGLKRPLAVDPAARLDQRVRGPAAAQHQHDGLLRAQQRGRLAARGALRGRRAAAPHERAQAAARRRRQQPAAHDEQQILSRRRTTQTCNQVCTLSGSADMDLSMNVSVLVLPYTALHAMSAQNCASLRYPGTQHAACRHAASCPHTWQACCGHWSITQLARLLACAARPRRTPVPCCCYASPLRSQPRPPLPGSRAAPGWCRRPCQPPPRSRAAPAMR